MRAALDTVVRGLRPAMTVTVPSALVTMQSFVRFRGVLRLPTFNKLRVFVGGTTTLIPLICSL